VSATLAGITVLSDQHPSMDLLDGESGRLNRRFEDSDQLALEGSVMAARTRSELCGERLGHTLD
jgi:hypothetical protein